MKYYLLDYENVNASGLDGIGELTSDCRIVLFYTKNSSKIDLGVFNMLRSMKAEMSIIEVHHGKQALDIQLASYLGYLIGTEPADTEYYIISKDKGYRNVQSFWPDRRIVLCRNLSPDSEIVDEPAPEKKTSSRSGSRGGRKSSAAKASTTAKAPDAEEESKTKAKASKTTRTSSRTKAQPKPVEDVKVEDVKKDAPKPEPAVSEEPKPNAFAEAAAIAKAVVEAKKARNEAAAKKAEKAEDAPPEKAETPADKAEKPAKKTRKTASKKKAAETKQKADDSKQKAEEAKPKADPKQKDAEAKQKAAEAKHKASDIRNEVNNEIQKRLSKENVDGDIINATASFVSKNIGKDGFKQLIYRGIIKEHGQKQGLAIYRLIKDIL